MLCTLDTSSTRPNAHDTTPRPASPACPPGYRTQFQGYSVRFSPFEEGRLAVATSQNYGIVGNGRQYVLQVCRCCQMAEHGLAFGWLGSACVGWATSRQRDGHGAASSWRCCHPQ